jgi:hypothetical protein
MVMFDLARNTTSPSRDWFYNGGGIWTVGVSDDFAPRPAMQGTLAQLWAAGRMSSPGVMDLSARPADPATSLFVLLSKAPFVPTSTEAVCLVNTQSLTSSLQDALPALLVDPRRATEGRAMAAGPRRYLFHVEAGITIADLGHVLAHHNPRLSLQAISGSPGATLAGAMATATHGAEFNWPLLIDSVKAVHLVGPGGLQWWVEGGDPVADPTRLLERYPDLAANRIVRKGTSVGGIDAGDWLGAAVVSLGCLGIIYSVVLEVVPLFGVREVVVQRTWRTLPLGATYAGRDTETLLRAPATTADVSSRIVRLMQNGALSGTGIPQVDNSGNAVNQYADLAINAIRRPDGDLDCWIANREVTAQLPLDAETGSTMVDGVTRAFDGENLNKLARSFGLNDLSAVTKLDKYSAMINRLTRATDLIDVGLDTLLTPITNDPFGREVAQPLLTGILSGLLGTANCDKRADITGVSVGNLGFPASGIMGVGIEVALAPSTAFGFVQTEILDRIPRTFYGYVSIRLCRPTETLLGMQQFSDPPGTPPGTPGNPVSVMVEVVGFGNPDARTFMQTFQQRTLALIAGGLNAMVHWGLENDQLRASHLGATGALLRSSSSGMTKLATFKAVRAVLQARAPGAFRAFDSAFTDRLGFSSRVIGFQDDSGASITSWTPTAWNTSSGTPLVAGTSLHLRDLRLFNRTAQVVRVDQVRVVSSADRPGAPVFKVLGPQTPFSVPAPAIVPSVALVIDYLGAPAGSLTGTVLVSCNQPAGEVVAIELSTVVAENRHAELSVSPASVDLGTVIAPATASATVSLTNTGAHPAEIFNVDLVDESPIHGQFDVPFSTAFTVSPGATRTVVVNFDPATGGTSRAVLAIDMRSPTDIQGRQHHEHHDVPVTVVTQAPRVFLSDGQLRRIQLTTLDFGAIAPSTSVGASFWIRNGGDAPLEVGGVDFDTAAFGVPGPAIFPATLQPSEGLEVPCTFAAPTVPGMIAEGALIVRCNDPRQRLDPGVGRLLLTGRATGAHLSNPGERIDLGNLPPASESASLVCRSEGTAAVRIGRVSLDSATHFSVTSAPSRGYLSPGSELIVTVTLTSTQPGEHEDFLRILASGIPDGEYQVLVKGTVS